METQKQDKILPPEPTSCRLFQLRETKLPDGVAEAFEFAKARFDQREQWAYLRLCVEHALYAYSSE